MKKILCFLLFLALSFGTGAVVGYHYDHAKNQSEIAEIERVAQESCALRVKTAQKLCKK